MKIIKVLYLAFLFSTLHCLVIQSQSINALFNDSSLNYYQVRNLGYNNSEIIKQSDPREIKSFQRWDMYWKNRYDSKEGYEKIANVMREHLLKQTGSISQKIQKSDSTIFASKKSSIINSSFQESSLMYDNNQVCIPIGPESTPSSICSGSYNPTGIGRVESIWANSSLSSTIYAGGSNGGLWKKTYTGEWECLTDDLYSFGVMDIAVHPTNSNKIYIATGCMVASGSSLYNGGYGLGIFSSSDGGNTWSSGPFSEPEFDGFVRKIVIDPVSPNILYALSRKKLYKSTDGGASWDYMNNPYSVETEFIDLAISPSDHNIIYICARTNEIYCSTNGGSSWSSNLADNLTEPSTKVRMGIAVTPAQGNALFAVYMRGSYAYLDKSTDNGNTWVNLAADYVYAGNHTPLRLAISPTDINNIYVGGISFYKYSSTSSSFVLKSASNMSPPNYLHSDIRKILVVDDGNGSDIVYVGTDGGIAVSYDETSSWSYIEEGLQMGLFYSLSSSDADPGTLVGGTHDCSSHIFSNNSWQNTSCLHCDGGSSLVKDDNSNHMFIQCNGSIYRSLDGGTNWSSIGESSTEYDCPIIEDPSNGNTIYVGSNWNPKVSYDNGSSFQTLATLGDDRTTNIAVSASNPNVLYYARANYICRSDGTCRYNKTWLIRRSDDGSSWID
ncbi:MAG: WD40/YVTN/BNR-like repeat-containing protein, partial [Cyclobacteriaceae bacterium]